MNDEYNKSGYWFEIAEYDIETAKAMLKTKRFLYVGFMCHQAIEKILKGVYVLKYHKVPPYTHNLKQLIDKTGIDKKISREQLHIIALLTPLNIEARYPKSKEMVSKLLDQKKCEEIIEKTEGFYRWIKINQLK